jgi:phage FluMu protein Com
MAVTEKPVLLPWRCAQCGGTLARFSLARGSTVSVKCQRCKAINTFTA